MPGLEQYMTPIHPDARPDWLTMIRQGQQMPPDQAQINQSIAPPANISDVPMVQNFQPASGLSNYLPPASRAIDRSIIDQYRDQSKRSVLEQEAGVSKLEDQSRELATQKSPVDWTAVASLVDSMNAQNGTKTNLYESALANRGLTPDQKQDKLLKFEEYIQGAKGAVSKEKLQALQQTLAMVHQNDQSDLLRAHYANTEKASDERSRAFNERNDIQRDNQAKQVADIWDKDPIIKPQMDRLNQIKLDKHTIEMGGVISPQVMDEIAQGIATALSGGKAAGWNASEGQQLTSLGKDLAKRRAYFENKQFNALSPENAKFLTGLLNRLETGYGNAIGRRSDYLRQGRNYKFNPGAQQVMDDKHAFYSSFGDQANSNITQSKDPHSLKVGTDDEEIDRQYDELRAKGLIK